MSVRIGSLFSGYGGLDLAVEAVTGGQTVWHSDIEPAAATVLTNRWPDAPNLGDIAAVDWSTVEPVDVLAGGFPCQDVSAAGKRRGLIRYGSKNGKRRTRSGLWAEMARAIDNLRPALVVAENVRGLLSAKTDADPAVLPCPSCVDERGGDASLGMRALGAVLGDLAVLGYDAAWRVVRASDVGAPHQRARVFVVAWPAGADRAGLAQWSQQPARDERSTAERGDSDTALMPTPEAKDASGGRVSADLGGFRPSGAKRAITLASAVHHMLPTPSAGGHSVNLQDVAEHVLQSPERWGKYADAVARWENLTRPAPEPTETGPRGGQRLAPPFVEWMMGLPAGWVTDPALKLTRNEQLKALGNGVVPHQAEDALRGLLADVSAVTV